MTRRLVRRRCLIVGAVERLQLRPAFFEHRRIDEGVTAIDALGEVSRHGHGRGAWDASALQIAVGGTAEIMKQHARESGCLARASPRAIEKLDRRAVPVEHPRDDGAGLLLDGQVCAGCCSRIALRSGVNGKDRPSPFFVSPVRDFVERLALEEAFSDICARRAIDIEGRGHALGLHAKPEHA